MRRLQGATFRAFVLLGIMTFVLAACSSEKQEETASTSVEQPQAMQEALPEGHPSMGGDMQQFAKAAHSNIKSRKEVRLPAEVTEKWNEVRLEVLDNATNKKEVLRLKVGEEAALGESGLKLKVEAFVPDYTMAQDYITTRSNDPNNPAVLVELFDGDRSVARGWVFKMLPDFNSYKHDRIALTLLTPGSE